MGGWDGHSTDRLQVRWLRRWFKRWHQGARRTRKRCQVRLRRSFRVSRCRNPVVEPFRRGPQRSKWGGVPLHRRGWLPGNLPMERAGRKAQVCWRAARERDGLRGMRHTQVLSRHRRLRAAGMAAMPASLLQRLPSTKRSRGRHMAPSLTLSRKALSGLLTSWGEGSRHCRPRCLSPGQRGTGAEGSMGNGFL